MAANKAMNLKGFRNHSVDEGRYITIGVSDRGRHLKVSHTERGNRIRISHARELTRAERETYEEHTYERGGGSLERQRNLTHPTAS
jgi:uncharacterized DUF497 family protein